MNNDQSLDFTKYIFRISENRENKEPMHHTKVKGNHKAVLSLMKLSCHNTEVVCPSKRLLIF